MMNTLIISIYNARKKNYSVICDGEAVGLKRNRYGMLEGVVNTEKDTVCVRVEDFNELRSPLWFVASLFFFIVSLFGIFDVRRTYDKKGRAQCGTFNVTFRENLCELQLKARPFMDGTEAFGTDGNAVYEEIENLSQTDKVLRRRARIIIATKILLWIALIAGIIAAVLLSI